MDRIRNFQSRRGCPTEQLGIIYRIRNTEHRVLCQGHPEWTKTPVGINMIMVLKNTNLEANE